MRKQFSENSARSRRNLAEHLGNCSEAEKGTLELDEEADILEAELRSFPAAGKTANHDGLRQGKSSDSYRTSFRDPES